LVCLVVELLEVGEVVGENWWMLCSSHH
jgi:hypothetical protein